MNTPRPDSETVAFLRKVLAEYDDGTITASEVDGKLFTRVSKEIVDVVGRSEPILMIGSFDRPKLPVKQVTAVFSVCGDRLISVGPPLDSETGMPFPERAL